MRTITILKRRMKENLVICEEYERCLKKCDLEKENIERQKTLYDTKIQQIKSENRNLEKSIEILEGKEKDEENV